MSARLQSAEELGQALAPVANTALHIGGDHRVTVLDRLEGRRRAQQRLAAALGQRRGLQADMTGRALELEGLHDAIWRRVAVEDAMEAVGAALGVGLQVA